MMMSRLPAPAGQPKLPTVTNPTTILLVEDDPYLREAVRILLEDAGYGIVEAGTAAQAVAAFNAAVPDMILLDLGLPDRHGLELARELVARPDGNAVSIVALTGRTSAEERMRALDAGCREVISKPVDPQTLLRRIPDLLPS